MKGKSRSANNGSHQTPAANTNGIAVDDDLLSAITPAEAAAVTPQMARIYLLLPGLLPADLNDSLQVAHEWLLRFAGEEQSGSAAGAWRQLRDEMTGLRSMS